MGTILELFYWTPTSFLRAIHSHRRSGRNLRPDYSCTRVGWRCHARFDWAGDGLAAFTRLGAKVVNEIKQNRNGIEFKRIAIGRFLVLTPSSWYSDLVSRDANLDLRPLTSSTDLPQERLHGARVLGFMHILASAR